MEKNKEKKIDGYVKVITNEEGKISYLDELWTPTFEMECYVGDCFESLFEGFTFHPNSLMLITFNIKCIKSDTIWGIEYEDELNIINDIVLVDDYKSFLRKRIMELDKPIEMPIMLFGKHYSEEDNKDDIYNTTEEGFNGERDELEDLWWLYYEAFGEELELKTIKKES